MNSPSERSTGEDPPPDDHRRPEHPATDRPPWLGTPLANWKLALGALGYATMWVCAFEIDNDAIKIVTSTVLLLASCAFLFMVARRERRRGHRRPRSSRIPPELRRPLILRQFLAVALSVVVAIVGTRTLHTALAGSALHWLLAGAFIAVWAFITIRLLEHLAVRSYRRWLDTQPA